MFSSIQTKIITLFLAILVTVLLVLVLVITNTVETQTVEKVKQDFRNSQAAFEQIQKTIFDRLVETSLIISEQPIFKGNLSLVNSSDKTDELVHNSLMVMLNDFAQYIKADLIIVTDKDGKVLADLSQENVFGHSILNKETVQRSVNGISPELSPQFIDVWDNNGELFQVVTVPAYVQNSNSILGTLTLGTKISQIEADSLKSITGLDVSFVLNDQLISSTLQELEKALIIDDLGKRSELISQVKTSMKPTDVFENNLGVHSYFNVMSVVGAGTDAFYILSTSQTKELASLRNIQKLIYFSGALSLIFSLLFSVVLAKGLTKPIVSLSEGVKKIRDGNFEVNVKQTTKDEIGVLTHSFNEMAKELKERFQLLRYVGSHTKEMIKSSTSTEAKMGGERKDVTVLFSDIRGFTSYSEQVSPEEVIAMLNEYLSVQADLVEKYVGSVDKYVGDEMVAIFLGEDHAERAIWCAREIIKISRTLNEKKQKPIAIGIGINSGQVVLGNMGSRNRLDYTVIGSNVNLGARLCSAAKAQQILVSDRTYEMVTKKDYFTILEPMMFKGIANPIQIYEVNV